MSFPSTSGGRDYKIATRFRDTGNGLLLFVHGLGCSKQVWKPAWQRIELRDRSLFAFDLPGFGQTPPPPDYSYDLARQADILAAIIDSHAGRDIHLVAHSMGGSLALLLPARTVARLSSLMLVEPRLFLDSCGIAPEAANVDLAEFRRTVFTQLKRRLSSDPAGDFDLDRSDVEAFHASSCSLVKWADDPRLLTYFNDAECHKCVVIGANNSHLRETRAIDSTLLRFIDRSGHFPMHDNPADFYRELADFIDG